MRSFTLVLALVGFALAQAAEIEVEDGVLVVTEDNYQQIIDENEYVLMEFYAPWCGHCKSLAPEYAKAAKQLDEENSPVKLCKVDATVHKDLATDHGVKGYPTIKFFKNGVQSEFGGGRTAPDIISWLTKRMGPAAESLTTLEDAEEFSAKDEVVVIGFFEKEDSDNAQAYINAAESLDSLPFGIVTSAEIAEGMKAKLDSIVLFKKFDEGRATLDEVLTTENILSFIAGEQLPLVTKFSDQTAPRIFGGQITSHFLAFTSGDSEDILAGMKEAAQEFKGKILFVQIDMDDEASARVADFFNVVSDDAPTSRLISMDGDIRKYLPEFEGLGSEDIKQFVRDYLEGKLKVHLNTEDVPEDWDANPVKILVGKNFDDVVFDENKYVFVEFYAPWCGHCKQLAPIWDQLAEHFAEKEDIVIAKMDATKNEVENVAVQAFPTLKFIVKETNEILDYDGGRTLEDLIQYVENTVSGVVSESDQSDVSDDEDVEDMEDDKLEKDEL